MITSRATKSSETTKFQNKCMFIWLMVLSVLLIAVLAALIAIGFKLYKTDCTCNNDADKVAVDKRSNNNTAAFVPPVKGILPSYNEMVLIEFIKVYTDKAKDEIKCQLTEDVKKQLVSLEKKVISKIEHNYYKKLNWTSLSSSTYSIDTASPGTVLEIRLSAIGVPQDATEVFVYVIGATGWCFPNGAQGEIEIYSHVSMKQHVHMHSWTSDDWSYNSDNLWVPIGKNRNLYGKYIGKAITGSRYARVRVIGYR